MLLLNSFRIARWTALIVAACTSTVLAADPLMTNSTSFRIPFAVESDDRSPVSGTAILFSAVNGAPLEQVQRVNAGKGGFEFTAPSDGRYAFAVRMTDASGKLMDEETPLAPELEVIVDTVAPKINIRLAETSPGVVSVAWNSDSPVTPGSVRLEYAEGANGRWQAIETAMEPTGNASLRVAPGTSVSVRAYLTDLAGNEGTGTQQIVLATPPERQPAGTAVADALPDATNLTGVTETTDSGGPIIGLHPFSGGRDSAIAQGPTASSAPQTDFPPAQMIPPRNAPLQNLNDGQTLVADPQSAGQPYQNVPRNTAPVDQNFGAPAANQLVKSSVFDIAYQVEDVGPSGVSAVELFVTENGGQQWFRYGRDIDLRTPFQVDTRGEGTFGFSVRVHNGLGFSDPPPQPGELPSIVVTVDQTAPTIRLGRPQVVTTGRGAVVINWQVADRNPSPTPVRLEFSGSPSGPWTPLFDWQADRRGFQMPIQSGISSSLYFRLLARDAAGNVATAQTPQPVVIDQHRPQARLLRIQPAAFRQQSF